MSSIPKARIHQLLQLRAMIFKETYNPNALKTGSKVLTKKLRGEYIKNYYIPRYALPTAKMITEKLIKDVKFTDPAEDERLSQVESRKRKGKSRAKVAKAAKDKRSKR